MSHLNATAAAPIAEGGHAGHGPTRAHRLRLLTYNIQAGVSTSQYRHYITKSWKHVLHHPQRFTNLDRIGQFIQDFDLVGLQELDAGSARCGFVNLAEYLSEQAGFPFWYAQTNRRLGPLARHSIGMLSRVRPVEVSEHKLPGRIPGRGMLCLRFGTRQDHLLVMIVHLALSRRARLRQLAYIAEVAGEHPHVVLMGDMNFPSRSPEMDFLMARTGLREPIHGLNSFPSWRPARNIDHILVSPTLGVHKAQVLNYSVSDHLPIAMEVALPEQLQLPAAG